MTSSHVPAAATAVPTLGVASPQAPDSSASTLPADARPSLGRLVGVELRKLVDTRAGIATLAVATLLAGATAAGQTLRGLPTSVLDVALMALLFAPYFLVGIAAALVTGEYTHGSALGTYALVPRRSRVLRAKAVAVVVLAVCVGVAAAAGGALVSAVAPALGAGPVSWDVAAPDGAGGAGLRAVVGLAGLVVAPLIGWALAMATRSLAVTLALFLVWPMVATLVGGLSPAAARVLEWTRPDTIYALSDGVTSVAAGRTVTGLLLWLVLPAVVGLVRLTREEIR